VSAFPFDFPFNPAEKKLNFLFLEPFYGGSHKDFAQGLVSHSKHKIDLVTLPARFWKWRMRGAALYFVKKIPSLKSYDGLITTDLMSLSDFKALCGPECPPAVVYFHENQLTYPLAPGESRDFQFGFTDITTSLVADRIIFNSQSHFDAFFSKLPGFLNMMPEFQPKWVVDEIHKKADVLYPGCHFPALADVQNVLPETELPPLIIWNHRWEFDKNPVDFFSALDQVRERGLNFRLALLGENFQVVPKEFMAARKRFKNRIVCYGYEVSRKKYRQWLMQGTIVISTANQENFGISVIEAIHYGCIPLLPDRLSYPEIVPKVFHGDFLYKNQTELVEKLCFLIQNYSQLSEKQQHLSAAMKRFAWENMVDQYDEILRNLALKR
jgi:glycosyltransferase involved in cell wall biosynthesis